MAIRSLIKSALLQHGWIITRAPSEDTVRTAQLVDLLTQDTADGRARRHAVASWLGYERPVIERFEGHQCALTVEGPIYCNDHIGYPMGSQLRTHDGWLDLYPAETNELADELRSAIDGVLLRWFTAPHLMRRQAPCHQPRERQFDDPLALNLIRSATRSASTMEHDARDK